MIYVLNSNNAPFEVITDFNTSELKSAEVFDSIDTLRDAYNSRKTADSLDFEDRILTVEDMSDRLGFCLGVIDQEGNSGDIENISLIDFLDTEQ